MIEQGKLKFGLKWGKYQVVDEMVKIAIFAYEFYSNGGILKMKGTYCVDKPARKSGTIGGMLTLSVYHLGIMACIF
ncbi:Guanine nucleotide-releasing factor 2 [Gossypium arboreum]|uniref:Guanine nucleotide-releasing factor 2 n=1 Tax=Gossypium arboreum TaxID=29729 RepID=A0A0B0NQ99_GOSAR|nr:Guanine nucleotide-releasing factor 2 [Gossypium arboreum]